MTNKENKKKSKTGFGRFLCHATVINFAMFNKETQKQKPLPSDTPLA